MKNTNARLKGDAREILIGKYSVLIAAFLISDFLSYGLSALVPMSHTYGFSTFSMVTFLVCSLIIYFLTMILSVGSNHLYLNVARGNNYRISDIFYCFTHQPDKVILLAFRLFLINLGCMLPFLAAATAVIVRTPALALFPGVFFSFPVLGAAALSLLLALIVNLRYVLVFYLYLDQPWMTSGELMRQSSQLMKGKKLRFLLLQLSFLGMALLVILSLGLGLLWLHPYVTMTNTLFYLDAIGQE